MTRKEFLLLQGSIVAIITSRALYAQTSTQQKGVCMTLSAYFWDGFRHAAAGGACAAGVYYFTRSDLHKRWTYWIALIMSSSAFFFLPAHVGRYGSLPDRLYQFLHYPLADWDILALSIQWHRFFVTHSLLIPLLALIVALHHPAGRSLALGLCVGHSSHLAWDAITCSLRTPIVFWNNALEIRGYPAKGWLLVHGLLLFVFAVFVARKTDTGKNARGQISAGA